MLQYVPWRRITFTGKLFNVGEGKATTVLFLLKCFIYMLLDISIWVILTFLSYKFLVLAFFVPLERGFSCNDPNIREDFVPNTISTTALLAITLGAPFFFIFLADLLRTARPHRRHITQVINRSTYVYLNFCITFWLMTLAIDALKCLTGRIRPNFLSMCKPRELHEVCAVSPDAFVPLAHCTAGWKHSRNSKMSFPSGHAAASVFCTLFLFFYLRGLRTKFPTFLLNSLYLLVSVSYVAFSLFCCISRVTDSWHFPSDVLGGVLLGSSLYFVFLHKHIIPHQ